MRTKVAICPREGPPRRTESIWTWRRTCCWGGRPHGRCLAAGFTPAAGRDPRPLAPPRRPPTSGAESAAPQSDSWARPSKPAATVRVGCMAVATANGPTNASRTRASTPSTPSTPPPPPHTAATHLAAACTAPEVLHNGEHALRHQGLHLGARHLPKVAGVAGGTPAHGVGFAIAAQGVETEAEGVGGVTTHEQSKTGTCTGARPPLAQHGAVCCVPLTQHARLQHSTAVAAGGAAAVISWRGSAARAPDAKVPGQAVQLADRVVAVHQKQRAGVPSQGQPPVRRHKHTTLHVWARRQGVGAGTSPHPLAAGAFTGGGVRAKAVCCSCTLLRSTLRAPVRQRQ